MFREYERSMTTILNASVMPVVSTYVERLDAAPRGAGHRRAAAADEIERRRDQHAHRAARSRGDGAVRPGGRRVGAAYVGASSGHPDLIGIDIGGTSADITLIHGGEPGLTTNGRIGHWPDRPAHGRHRHDRRWRWLDRARLGHRRADGGAAKRWRRAGPRLLRPRRGRADRDGCPSRARPSAALPPRAAASRSMSRRRGTRSAGASPSRSGSSSRRPRAASWPSSTTTWWAPSAWCRSSAATIRAISRCCRSAERGRCTAARWRGCSACRRSSCRRGPGVLSALGLLVSNLKAEFTRTCLQKAGAFDADAVARVFAELEAEAVRLARCRGRAGRGAQGRLVRQPALSAPGLRAQRAVGVPRRRRKHRRRRTVAAFHRLHERLYTFAQEDTPVEIVTLRVDARRVYPSPAMQELPPAGRPRSSARRIAEPLFLETGRAEAAIYARERLGAGARIRRPRPSSPSSMRPRCCCRDRVGTVDRSGNLIVSEAS